MPAAGPVALVGLVAALLPLSAVAQGAASPGAQALAIEAEAAPGQPGQAQPAPAAQAPRSFVLDRVIAGPSAYLPRDEVERVAASLRGRRISAADTAAITAAFDALYDARGIALAQTLVRRIDPARGSVEVEFFEARLGRITPQGSLATPEVYAARIGLRTGDLADNRVIERNLRLLAVTSGIVGDARFQPGAAVGETDLVVLFDEPPRFARSLTLDNHGTRSTGRYRLSFSFIDRSATGNLDPLTLGLTLTEGVRSLSASYARPLDARGLAAYGSLSGEWSRTVVGADVRGHSFSAELGLSRVMLAEADSTLTLRGAAIAFGERKRTAGVVTTDQRGSGVLLGATYTRSGDRASFSYDQTLRYARWRDNVLGGGGRNTIALAGDLSLSVPLTEDVAASFRGGWQRVFGADSPVQFRGSLASPGRVRGYPSGVSSGDHYVFGSLQVQSRRPIAPRGGRLELFPYAFVDAGRAWDRVGGVTTAQDALVSAGVGAQMRFGRNGFGDISVARPLRNANGFSKSGKWQINAQIGITF